MKELFRYKPRWPHERKPDPKQCAASVSSGGGGPSSYQCTRKPWKGDWCKQHHPETVAERDRKREEGWARERAASEYRYSLPRAYCRIVDVIQGDQYRHDGPGQLRAIKAIIQKTEAKKPKGVS